MSNRQRFPRFVQRAGCGTWYFVRRTMSAALSWPCPACPPSHVLTAFVPPTSSCLVVSALSYPVTNLRFFAHSRFQATSVWKQDPASSRYSQNTPSRMLSIAKPSLFTGAALYASVSSFTAFWVAFGLPYQHNTHGPYHYHSLLRYGQRIPWRRLRL